MGYSISRVALQGKSKEEVLALTSFVDTGTPDEANEAPVSVASLPMGWTVLFFNDYEATTPELVVAWSKGCRAIACQVEENVMASNAAFYEDGRHLWTVSHQSDKGIYDLEIRGTPPEAFQEIKDRLLKQQHENDGETTDVDYVFDVPIEMATALCGYRHDESSFDWGTPAFTSLATRRRSLWSRLGLG